MKFEETVIRSYPTGSRYICNPAPVDTDNDTIFLVNGYYQYADMLAQEGWDNCGRDYEKGGDFQAWRKGEENYILTEDPEFFESYIKATEGAKALNLLNKQDRINLFVAVLQASKGYIGFKDKFEKLPWAQFNIL